MDKISSMIVILAMAAVVGVLITGIAVFVKGGDFNRRHANTLMNLRVGIQAVAVAALGLVLLLHAFR